MAASTTKKYQLTNWSKYNAALTQRGSITFWFSDDVLEEWQHANDEVKVGRPFTFSDRAIESCLMIREVFQLPYRQTEGFVRSLLELMQVEVLIPDYTSLAKRAVKLAVDFELPRRRGPIDIVVDSTGLKVYGEGEWKMRQHGKSKRRTWRKLHLAVNPQTQEIEAEVLTENSASDADPFAQLLEEVSPRITTCAGDGGYDKWKVYRALAAQGVQPLIPPQRNAKIKQHGNSGSAPLPRDEAIRRIRQVGRKKWKQEIGYHCRSLAETAMYRMKTIFGNKLKNRLLAAQQTEARIRCKVLNAFTRLGMPVFQWN